MTDQPVPNPGSDEAREAGCICAVLDNNRGILAPWPPNGWYITEGCLVHDQRRKGDGDG